MKTGLSDFVRDGRYFALVAMVNTATGQATVSTWPVIGFATKTEAFGDDGLETCIVPLTMNDWGHVEELPYSSCEGSIVLPITQRHDCELEAADLVSAVEDRWRQCKVAAEKIRGKHEGSGRP